MLFYSNLFTGKCIIYSLFIRLPLLPKKRKLFLWNAYYSVRVVPPVKEMKGCWQV